MNDGLLRDLIREHIKLLHGSPYGGIRKFTDFKGRIPFIFFTPSKQTALEYTNVLNLAGADPGGERTTNKTLYHVEIGLSDSEIFDTGKHEDHKQLYRQCKKEAYQADSENILGALISTPVLPGSTMRAELPPFSSIYELFPFVAKRGFRAIWFSEGVQGPSLAIRIEDAGLVRIEQAEELESTRDA